MGVGDCLEIIGIPKEEKESPKSLVIKLGEMIGVEFRPATASDRKATPVYFANSRIESCWINFSETNERQSK